MAVGRFATEGYARRGKARTRTRTRDEDEDEDKDKDRDWIGDENC